MSSGGADEKPEIEARIAEREGELAAQRTRLEEELQKPLDAAARVQRREGDRAHQGGNGTKARRQLHARPNSVTPRSSPRRAILLEEDLAVEVQRRAAEREDELLRATRSASRKRAKDAADAEIAGARGSIAGLARRARGEHPGGARRAQPEMRGNADGARRRCTVRDLLTDTQYREYVEKFGKVFKAGIGAESVRELLSADRPRRRRCTASARSRSRRAASASRRRSSA